MINSLAPVIRRSSSRKDLSEGVFSTSMMTARNGTVVEVEMPTFRTVSGNNRQLATNSAAASPIASVAFGTAQTVRCGWNGIVPCLAAKEAIKLRSDSFCSPPSCSQIDATIAFSF